MSDITATANDPVPNPDDLKLFSAKEVNTLLVPRIDEIDVTIQEFKNEFAGFMEDFPEMVAKQMTVQRELEREEKVLIWRERRKTMLKALPVGGLGGFLGFIFQVFT